MSTNESISLLSRSSTMPNCASESSGSGSPSSDSPPSSSGKISSDKRFEVINTTDKSTQAKKAIMVAAMVGGVALGVIAAAAVTSLLIVSWPVSLPVTSLVVAFSIGAAIGTGSFIAGAVLAGTIATAVAYAKGCFKNEGIEKTKDVEKRATVPDRQIARNEKNRRISPPKITPKEKFQRCAEKAKHLGKGLNEMERNGFQGKVLGLEYGLEAFSPHHEHIEGFSPQHMSTPYFNLLKMFWNGSKLSFDEWIKTKDGKEAVLTFKEVMEAEPTVQGDLSKLSVAYLNEKERAGYKICFVRDEKSFNTRLQLQGSNFNTSNSVSDQIRGRAIFVMDAMNRMYVGNGKTNQFHHSSFLSAAAVKSAGELITDSEGHLVAITNKSGHYKPGKQQMLNALEALSIKGVDLSHVELHLVSEDGEDDKFDVYNASKFLDSAGECQKTRTFSMGEESVSEIDSEIEDSNAAGVAYEEITDQ